MNALIDIYYKDKLSATRPLDPGSVVSIGRSRLCDIHLGAAAASRTDTSVSRMHAALIPTSEGGWLLQDLGSLNGTTVATLRTAYAYLVDSERIRIGDYTLVYREERGEAATSTPVKTAGKSPSFDIRTRLAPLVESGESEIEELGTTRSLTILYRLIRAVAVQGDVEYACRMAIIELSKALGMSRGCAAIVDEHGTVIRRLGAIPENASTLYTPSLIEQVIKTGKPAMLEETTDNQGYAAGVREIAIPLLSSGRVSAFIHLAGDRAVSIPASERTLLGAISRDFSAAFEQQQHNRTVLLEKRALQSRIAAHHMIVGSSLCIKKVLHEIGVYGPTDVSVLILGETGTGKELVAQALHRSSGRRDGPFLELNCAAIPENILESELFGVIADYPGFHSREGLTGKIRAASGGTLFLDEIGDMSPALQAKILRFLDEKAIWPPGSTKAVPVDVRIIAATNRNLRERIREGAFREDLYQRLGVVEIAVPPLGQRREDIPLLGGYFLARLREKYGNVGRLSCDSVEGLTHTEWPGNVRELKNRIERAAIRAIAQSLSEITPDLLQGRDDPVDLRKLDDVERGHIVNVLRHTGGNREKAWKILGISRATLFNKINEYGLREFQDSKQAAGD